MLNFFYQGFPLHMNLAVGPSTTQRVDTKSIQVLQENQKHLKKVKYVCMVNALVYQKCEQKYKTDYMKLRYKFWEY